MYPLPRHSRSRSSSDTDSSNTNRNITNDQHMNHHYKMDNHSSNYRKVSFHVATNQKLHDKSHHDHAKKLEAQRSMYEALIKKLGQDHRAAIHDLTDSFNEELQKQRDESLYESLEILVSSMQAFVATQDDTMETLINASKNTANVTIALLITMGLVIMSLMIYIFASQI